MRTDHEDGLNANGGLRILVVDNDPDMADSSAILLRCFGHRVQFVSDGHSACQAALNDPPPDVVLLELDLPDLDGWEVARRLQVTPREKRPFLIALADYDTDEERCRSCEAGIDLHLAKPLAPDYLRRILERFHRIIMPTEPTIPT